MFSSLLVCLSVCLFVCLLVCLLATLPKTAESICMKFSGKVGNGTRNRWLDSGNDPDQDSRPGSVSRTAKTCLGGGMHCPSASRYYCAS